MKIVAEITKDTPVRRYRFIARCQECDWTRDWWLDSMAVISARYHVEGTGHARVVIEDTQP